MQKPDLNPRFIGVPAVNQFSAHNSSPRGVMFMGQFAQRLNLIHTDERITLSGLETELLKTVDNVVLESESLILALIPRYRSLDNYGIDKVVEYFVLYLDVDTNQLTYITVPGFKVNHQHFGFELNATSAFRNMNVGDEIPGGTVLSEPESVKPNKGYAFGRNLNVAFTSLKELAEDPIWISETGLKKMAFKLWETRVLKFSGDEIPLNLYGDAEHYKVIPDIGESVHESNVLFATREFTKEDMLLLSPSLFSSDSLRDVNPIFDNPTYVRGSDGVVVDVKVLRDNTKNKYSFYNKAVEQLDKYNTSMVRYQEEVLEAYKQAKISYPNATIAPKLHREVLDIYAKHDQRIKKVNKKDPISDYQVEVTVEYTVIPTKGFKVTTQHGSKGIISHVSKDEDMPIDEDCNRVDMLIDLRSVTARMNAGNVYEQYIGAASRRLRHLLRLKIDSWHRGYSAEIVQNVLTDKQKRELFECVKEFVSIFENEMSVAYNKVNDIQTITEILLEYILDEVRVLVKIDDKKPKIKLVEDIARSRFAPMDKPVKIQDGDFTYKPMMIGPMYIMLLDKIADMWLATASAKMNHFGVPVGASKVSKHRYPWTYNPVKFLSETEIRLITAYAGPETTAEIKDRALNHVTHERINRNILTAKNPMQIEDVAERSKYGFEDDHVLALTHSIFKSFGYDFKHVDE